MCQYANTYNVPIGCAHNELNIINYCHIVKLPLLAHWHIGTLANYNMEEKKDEKMKKRTSLKSILGGDILDNDFFRRQTKLLVLIMVLIIFYIHNRYASQQQQLEIDKLKQELIDIRYDALTRNSELMEKSRQSQIEEYIHSSKTDLQTPTSPPYLLK